MWRLLPPSPKSLKRLVFVRSNTQRSEINFSKLIIGILLKRELVQVVGSSPFGFSFRYQLPTDCITAKHLNVKDARFKVESNRILHTNIAGAKLLYIRKEEDVSKYSPMFSELIAYDLAIDLCMSLTQKRTLRADLVVERKEFMRDTRSADGQEGTNDARITDPTGDTLFDESV